MLIVLQQAAECLHVIEQSPGSSVMEAIQPCLTAVVRKELLKHQDQDVKVLLATCFCEITRITAPEAPYSDDVLRVTLWSQKMLNKLLWLSLQCLFNIWVFFFSFLQTIFRLIVGTFGGLADVNSHYFSRRVAILETVARYRACVVMLDLECNDLITDMFRTFLEIVR